MLNQFRMISFLVLICSLFYLFRSFEEPNIISWALSWMRQRSEVIRLITIATIIIIAVIIESMQKFNWWELLIFHEKLKLSSSFSQHRHLNILDYYYELFLFIVSLVLIMNSHRLNRVPIEERMMGRKLSQNIRFLSTCLFLSLTQRISNLTIQSVNGKMVSFFFPLLITSLLSVLQYWVFGGYQIVILICYDCFG